MTLNVLIQINKTTFDFTKYNCYFTTLTCDDVFSKIFKIIFYEKNLSFAVAWASTSDVSESGIFLPTMHNTKIINRKALNNILSIWRRLTLTGADMQPRKVRWRICANEYC